MRIKVIYFTILTILSIHQIMAQTDSLSNTNPEDYYYQIPAHAENYDAGSVASRLIDGVGFRFYWATANLTEEDLNYRPNDDARTCFETITHIHGLSRTTYNAIHQIVNVRPQNPIELSYEEMRNECLEYLKSSSLKLKGSSTEDFENYNMIFQRKDRRTEFPFWNLVNGPISDALWHVGQVVSFRRSSGNPFPSGVSVLRGTKRD